MWYIQFDVESDVSELIEMIVWHSKDTEKTRKWTDIPRKKAWNAAFISISSLQKTRGEGHPDQQWLSSFTFDKSWGIVGDGHPDNKSP